MTIKAFVDRLQQSHFSLTVEGEKLILKGDKSRLTDEQIAAIRKDTEVIGFIKANKQELISFLKTASQPEVKKRASNIDSMYRLSPLQEGMLFHGLYDGQTSAYLEQVSSYVFNADPELLKQTWQLLMEKHTILRTGFEHKLLEIPVQCVYNEVTLPFTIQDLRHPDAAVQQAAIDAFLAEDKAKGIDFKTPPLMRIALLQTGESNYLMVWTFHHILLDGWSISVLMEEFMQYYKQLAAGKTVEDTTTDVFEDYIRFISSQDASAAEQHWRQYMSGIEEGTLLPFIQANADRTKGIGHYHERLLTLDEENSRQAEVFARAHGLTINTLIQGVWAYLLHSYTGQDAITYGVIVSGRPEQLPGVEKRAGMYINTLPLFTTLTAETAIVEWLKQLQQGQIQCREHGYLSLNTIQQWTGISGDMFDSIFVFENYPHAEDEAIAPGAFRVDNVEIKEHSNYPLSVIVGAGAQIQVLFKYNAAILDDAYVTQLESHLRQVLLQMISSRYSEIGELSLLTEQEYTHLVYEVNQTSTPYPEHENISGLFSSQVQQCPDAIAAICGSRQLTYQSLDEQSGKLAHYLHKKGVTNETLVPVCMDRSLEMMIVILAILKAGGAYVPIDPAYPWERIRFMLEDAGNRIIITDAAFRDKMKAELAVIPEIICKEDLPVLTAAETMLPEVSIHPDQLAYIMYTSGSTGKPKGVLVTHRNIITLVYDAGYIDFKPEDAILSAGSLAFDATTFEYWGALLNGGRLVLSEDNNLVDIAVLRKTLINGRVTKLFMTAAWFNHLVDVDITVFEGLKHILVGGEKLSSQHVKKFHHHYPHIAISNGYGPTENTTFSLSYLINGNPLYDNVPIGVPLNNRTAYVLNSRLQPVPVGVTGELYVGGAGVARGYFNRPELTAEKFIAHPFSDNPLEKLYRTGDIARRLPDGNIEYITRADDQVKVRGYRIELGEVEAALQKCPLVKQCVVLAIADDYGQKNLVAWIVPQEEFDREAILDSLREQVPSYMVPGTLVEIDQLPLTANGKIDKKKLVVPSASDQTDTSYAPPRNQTEEKLVPIWQRLLKQEPIGIYDNFFDLGGHSLLAIRLVAAIRDEIGAELSVKTIFDFPTITTLADHLREKGHHAKLPPVTASQRPQRIPLSYSQERLWFIDQLEGSLHYHMPSVLRLKGQLHREALEQSLRAIIERHEVLRTSIIAEEGIPYQVIRGHEQWTLQDIDLHNLDENINTFINRPFDLSADYLLRAGVAVIGEEETMLVLVMHHIASDGWSAGILVQELSALYEQAVAAAPFSLPALPLQYADFAVWQRANVTGDFLQSQQTYWTEKLSGTEPLQLQTDYERPLLQSNAGAIFPLRIDPLLTAKLQQLSTSEGVTLYMTLLAAYKVLLYRYSGQEDICVGTVAAGRQQKETENLIGFFVNTFALRSEVNGNLSFTSLLKQVKATLLESYEHQYLPFEKVVELVVKDRDMSRSPLFQAMFVSEDAAEGEFRLGNLQVSPGQLEYTASKFDLNFMWSTSEEGIDLNIVYCSDLFAPATIERMAKHFEQLLWSAVTLPSQEVGALYMLAPEEEQTLLHQFCRQSAHLTGGNSKTIIAQFIDQVAKHPDAPAVVYEGRQLTYRELDERAGILAQFLKKKGIGHDKLVPICMERSLEMMVAILGILKAGGAYVPIDPAFPEDRIAWILEDTSSRIVLADRHLQPGLQLNNITTCIDLREDWQEISALAETAVVADDSHADHLAYVIYTSGSTGRPKGVMIEHAQLSDYLYGLHQRSNSEACRSFALVPTIATDLGNTVLFGALAAGAVLHIISAERITDAELLQEYFQANSIDCLKIVPSHWKALSTGGRLLLPEKLLIFGGEALQQDILTMIQANIAQGFSPGIQVYNHYGPTETTIGKCMYKTGVHSTGTGIPIGTPMAGAVAYITDKAGNLVPSGVGGELWIGGAGVARGYWNQWELTAEKFIQDPFSADPDARIYKTGDMARWLPDGNILFMGRTDDQVKIRGYRTEPGEIERVLQESGMVVQGIVMPRKDSTGNKYLAAYLVMKEGFTREQVLTMLRSRLPEYMIPAAILELKEIPLTANGKVNRKALPEPESSLLSGTPYVAPVTATEQLLAAIWEELLGVKQPGIHHNFFETGGHSLAAVRLLSHIRKAGYDIRLNDLMTHKTIATQASLLDRRTNGENVAATALPGGEHVVVLGGKTANRPLFIIPGGDGVVDWYDGIAACLEDTGPVYGISMPGLLEGEQPLDSVEALAAWNISRIRDLQPEGPYRLMAHSFGAYVLYEMIRQLEAVDEQVEQAIILDAPAARHVSFEDVDMLVGDALQYLEEYHLLTKPYPQWVQDLKARLASLPVAERRAFMLHAIHQQYVAHSGLPDLTQRTIRLLTSNASIGYTIAGKVNAPLLVIRAADQQWSQLGFDEWLGWKPFAEEVRAAEVPGDHVSMIKNDNAIKLAGTLNKYLNDISLTTNPII
ncbi:non-ribosomal peptide synthetase [Chitinophaga sp. HK235]|uniref:non-ribosomal peptide synthetase n=1 Tax=Chitinophaga sp. HK235 TaxID=2952571 RepID=UPI001BAE261A|nr:non-ribosomal peptide synthetase [Chitinophaga sp. HK235]